MGQIAGGTTKPLVRLGRAPGDCWEWLGPVSSSGYGNKTFNGKSINAKRWLWGQLFGPVPEGLDISSHCGKALCMNPHHFVAQEQAQANRSGLGASLLPEDVLEVRRARPAADALPGAKTAIAERLAERLGCSRSTIFDIWGKRSWKSLRARRPAVRAVDVGAGA